MNKDALAAVEENPELTPEFILMNEDDILRGILECATGKTSDDAYSTIEIRKNGITRRVIKYDESPIPMEEGEKLMLRFRIRGVDQDEYQKCRERATKYLRNPKLGNVKIADETNMVKLNDLLIYTATHPEDKAKVWDNQAAWQQLNILTGADMVSKLLLSGEKDAIIDVLEVKSGYMNNLEEVTKK
jgi:hypothetical protein